MERSRLHVYPQDPQLQENDRSDGGDLAGHQPALSICHPLVDHLHPFFFSCDINAIDDFTIRLLSNADVLNINQDELGQVAEVVRNTNNEVVMLKKLADGSRALAVFNRNARGPADIDVRWGELGECCARRSMTSGGKKKWAR